MNDIDPLYVRIADKLKKADSQPLLKMLQKIANPEQAKVILELPKSVDDIAKALGLDEKTVEKHLKYLHERGLVTPGRQGWNFQRNPTLLKDAIGSANPKYDDDEIFHWAHEMSMEDTKKLIQQAKNGEEVAPIRQAMRVIPKWRSIKDIPGVLPIEDTRQIFRENTPIVVQRCPCRVTHKDRLCKDKMPVKMCIAAGRAGENSLARGAGKELTYDEAMELLDKADQLGFVTTTGNSNRMPRSICSCCSDCCGLFIKGAETKPVLNQVPYAKSRFIIRDTPEDCIACGTCTDDRCPVDAISMKKYDGFEDERSYTDNDECIGCGLCVTSCPTDARKMKLVRPLEHIPDLRSMFD